ncbi:hypothetical protein ADIARSV_3373 [Arcticibacter svalbardensis MN12-7]|uniref:Uncharacterized protein n=1 Tax=Arcticibacter svalbardensis MN12-7 TaxID=1150600 RepID=R9GWU5_9SPHI|nr:hypothetical protein ADIARSV_3373 [Arcticibacter svalbardensis MN12-7]
MTQSIENIDSNLGSIMLIVKSYNDFHHKYGKNNQKFS